MNSMSENQRIHTARGIAEKGREAAPRALLYLGISFVLMLLLTRSSFLYPYNNWDDANSYFSMGKSMMNGAVIYRDIFDQKGPYLYLLYGLCSLVSRTDFTGVFIMEVLLGAVDLWLIRRILHLYCSGRTSLVLAPVLFACMCASKSFYWGGSAEELCLPFLLYPLYLLLRTLEEGKADAHQSTEAESSETGEGASAAAGTGKTDHLSGGVHFRARDVFAAGLCCGVVFCIKFTLMGFYLAFAVVVILTCRSRKEFWSLAGWYLLGILLPFVPWVIYFAANGALFDWYNVYIYTNVFIYSDFGENSHGETMASRIYDLAKLLYWLILDNYQYFVFIIAGLLWMLVRRGASILSRLAPILVFGLTFFFIYIGGATLPYYAVPLTVLASPGMGAAGRLIDRLAAAVLSRRKEKTAQDSPGRNDSCPGSTGVPPGTAAQDAAAAICDDGALTPVMLAIAAGTMLLSLLICYHYSWNTYYLFYDKEDVFLTRFTEDIQSDRESGLVDGENTTLLNIGCLDCGLYTTADIYPSCYWFQTQTLPGDDVSTEQLRYITEAQTDYVVARDTYPDAIFAHYELIDTYHQVMGTSEFDYYLFRRISE